ncbi:MAG: ECF-type sigma factor [Acidobacteriota bacterium]
METGPGDITAQLLRWSDGDPAAIEDLLPLVVSDLRRAAHHYFQHESAGHTLQPTALVNEVCLRLLGWRHVRWDNRAQFYSFAGKLMRRLLVDHARARLTRKRGRGAEIVSLTGAANQPVQSTEPSKLLDLHRALEHLDTIDPRACRVVELRFFGGLSLSETAEALEISPATVKRDWALAKQWLAQQLG